MGSYLHDESVHNTRAPSKILPFVFDIFRPRSVLDVGCGTGTWLHVARHLGCSEIFVVEVHHLDVEKIILEKDRMIFKDPNFPFNLNRKFDLIFCIEVAEHLCPESVESLVDSLCLHSDIILFSAAIPYQGGQNHLNEQWPDWWQDLFEKRGFLAYDIIRPKFWNDKDVFYWYKQNLIIYSRKPLNGWSPVEGKVLSHVHPHLFEQKANQLKKLQEGRLGIYTGFRVFINSFYRLFQK